MNTTTNGVIEFLTTNPNSNKGQIADSINLRGLGLFNLLKKMVNEGQIIVEGEGHDSTYRVAEPQSEEVVPEVQPIVEQTVSTDATTEGTQVVEEPTNKDELPAGIEEIKDGGEDLKNDGQQKEKTIVTKATTTSTRDNTKYSVNGEGEYGKGPLVRAVLELHLKKNPTTTFKQLKELFPDTLMKRFGVFEEIAKAKEISGKTDRYFMKTEHVLKTGDKKQVVVCSQWTSILIVPFIEAAKKLGYKIK